MKARLTRASFCTGHLTPASAAIDQDVERRLVRAALLDQLEREVQVDVVPGRQRYRVTRVEARADQLLGAPVLDALDLRLRDDVYFSRSHVPRIRCETPRGSPPEGGSLSEFGVRGAALAAWRSGLPAAP